MNWITENICNFMTDCIGGTIDMFGEYINNIFYFVVDMATENAYIKGAQSVLITLSLSLVSLIVAKMVMSGYLLETGYDPEEDPFNLIVRIAQAVAVITNSGWVFNYLLNLSKTFADDLLGSAAAEGYAGQTKALLELDKSNLHYSFIAYCIILLVIQLAFLIFTITAGLRGAELIAMNLFMPVFSLDLLTNSRERWNNFFMGYLMAFFSYTVQVLFFNVALKSYASTSINRPEYFIGTIVFMIMAIKSPKFLEKYIYKTGMASAASGGVRMAAQTMMMRAVYRR